MIVLLSNLSVLSRVKAFLPQLATANEQLQQQVAQDPAQVDIEHIDEDEGQYIEMVSTTEFSAILEAVL